MNLITLRELLTASNGFCRNAQKPVKTFDQVMKTQAEELQSLLADHKKKMDVIYLGFRSNMDLILGYIAFDGEQYYDTEIKSK